MAATRSSQWANRCQVCGQYVADDDPYADSHMIAKHPSEYEQQMVDFRRRQAEHKKG